MKLDQILASLPDTEADALRNALASSASHTEIAATLTRHGYSISEAAVRRWKAKHE